MRQCVVPGEKGIEGCQKPKKPEGTYPSGLHPTTLHPRTEPLAKKVYNARRTNILLRPPPSPLNVPGSLRCTALPCHVTSPHFNIRLRPLPSLPGHPASQDLRDHYPCHLMSSNSRDVRKLIPYYVLTGSSLLCKGDCFLSPCYKRDYTMFS